ncbi:hypothetical protein I317_00017 [Kwoniella heveanensis CBS 569]|nr:hypothetical protein I317_00017 [Kwoniella heveanensis CBS 569]
MAVGFPAQSLYNSHGEPPPYQYESFETPNFQDADARNKPLSASWHGRDDHLSSAGATHANENHGKSCLQHPFGMNKGSWRPLTAKSASTPPSFLDLSKYFPASTIELTDLIELRSSNVEAIAEARACVRKRGQRWGLGAPSPNSMEVDWKFSQTPVSLDDDHILDVDGHGRGLGSNFDYRSCHLSAEPATIKEPLQSTHKETSAHVVTTASTTVSAAVCDLPKSFSAPPDDGSDSESYPVPSASQWRIFQRTRGLPERYTKALSKAARRRLAEIETADAANHDYHSSFYGDSIRQQAMEINLSKYKTFVKERIRPDLLSTVQDAYDKAIMNDQDPTQIFDPNDLNLTVTPMMQPLADTEGYIFSPPGSKSSKVPDVDRTAEAERLGVYRLKVDEVTEGVAESDAYIEITPADPDRYPRGIWYGTKETITGYSMSFGRSTKSVSRDTALWSKNAQRIGI